MTISWKELLVFLILFAANMIQAITGFAGTLLGMPPTIQLIGVDEAKSVLAILDQLSCLLIVLTGFRHINWKEFAKMAVLMVAGMFIGMKLFEVFPIQQLLTLYGVMILCIAIWKLFGQNLARRLFPQKAAPQPGGFGGAAQDTMPQSGGSVGAAQGSMPQPGGSVGAAAAQDTMPQSGGLGDSKGKPPVYFAGMMLVILAAGVIHGMFVSGGALLVIYASTALKEKEEFRATMAMLWVTIGCYLTGNQIQAGHFNSHVIFLCAAGTIPLFAGIFIGTKLVKKIKQETFLKLTYVLLIVSGVLAIV